MQSEWIGVTSNYGRLHADLVSKGKIRRNPNGAELETDVPFKSPSAAAAVVLGRQANGRLDWREQGTRKTYGDWQNQQLDAVANETGPSE